MADDRKRKAPAEPGDSKKKPRTDKNKPWKPLEQLEKDLKQSSMKWKEKDVSRATDYHVAAQQLARVVGNCEFDGAAWDAEPHESHIVETDEPADSGKTYLEVEVWPGNELNSASCIKASIALRTNSREVELKDGKFTHRFEVPANLRQEEAVNVVIAAASPTGLRSAELRTSTLTPAVATLFKKTTTSSRGGPTATRWKLTASRVIGRDTNITTSKSYSVPLSLKTVLQPFIRSPDAENGAAAAAAAAADAEDE